MVDRKFIGLDGLEQLALIICEKTGVKYTNQAGGVCCIECSVEGILTILLDLLGKIKNRLSKCTINTTYLTSKEADIVDKILSKAPTTCFLSVDREKLDKSMEAWVYVNIDYNYEKIRERTGLDAYIEFERFSATKGVLTWGNSD